MNNHSELKFTALCGNHELVSRLLANGVTLENTADQSLNMSLLTKCVVLDHKEVVKILLDAGASAKG